MFDESNEVFRALMQQATMAMQVGEVPVGCVITQNGNIISRAHNKVEQTQDHTQHAEVIAIKGLTGKLRLKNFSRQNISLYSTLEPCCMCFALIAYYKIPRVYYFLEEQKFGGGSRIFTNKSAYYKPEIYHFESLEVKKMMGEFFRSKR